MLLTIYSQTWFTQNIQNEQPHEIRNEFNELNFLFMHGPTREFRHHEAMGGRV